MAARRPSRVRERRRGWLWSGWDSSRRRDYNLRFALKHLAEASDYRLPEVRQPARLAGLLADRAHLSALHSARHDPLERLQIVVHVQGESGRGPPARHMHADGADLALRRPHAGESVADLRLHTLVAECGDEHSLQVGHVLVHAADPHDRIAHELPGAVIRHRTASVGIADLDA